MNLIPVANLANILRKTLDLADPRLVNHGIRVANLVHTLLKHRNKHTPNQVRDICMAAILHDVGAYKTEEIDRMIYFETREVWSHSVYGYLYLKHFSPIRHLAPAIFYHHADYREYGDIGGEAFELGQIINIADRIDIFAHVGKKWDDRDIIRYFERNRDVKYRSDLMELFGDRSLYTEVDYDFPYPGIIQGELYNYEEAKSFLKMVVLAIDFRSSQTVTHTAAASSAAKAMAELLHMDELTVERIHLGAMVHDLGKQGIPVEILESPNRLSPKAMEIMKTHVAITDDILNGNIDETTRRIAVRHHEKINGSGYPYGLTGDELTIPERLVAVADIFSALLGSRSYKEPYPKEKAIDILDGMAKSNLLDKDLVAFAIERFDDITGRMTEASERIIQAYKALNQEFRELYSRVKVYEECRGTENFARHVGTAIFN